MPVGSWGGGGSVVYGEEKIKLLKRNYGRGLWPNVNYFIQTDLQKTNKLNLFSRQNILFCTR